MKTPDYECIVIGGGPAGSTMAARLASLKHSVLVLESEKFPRFHIGESLLPGAMPLFDAIGAAEKMAAADFVDKHGAEFWISGTEKRIVFHFQDGLDGRSGSTYQVPRDQFDKILLDNAIEQGAEVRCDSRVVDLRLNSGEFQTVVYRDSNGETHSMTCSIIADASGQSCLIGKRLGLQHRIPGLRKASLFAHYSGVRRTEGISAGNTISIRMENGWFWIIPLDDERCSVGVILDVSTYQSFPKDPVSAFEIMIAQCPELSELMSEASRLTNVFVISDYSYQCRRFAGDGYLLIGDAAAFIDPVFASGVHLAVTSGFEGGTAAAAALDAGTTSRQSFLGYERNMKRRVSSYLTFVRAFYGPRLLEIWAGGGNTLKIRETVISFLRGDDLVDLSSKFRLNLFFLLLQIQRYFPLAPRLRYLSLRPPDDDEAPHT